MSATDGTAWIFQPTYAAAWFEPMTEKSFTRLGPLKDALPAEFQRPVQRILMSDCPQTEANYGLRYSLFYGQ